MPPKKPMSKEDREWVVRQEGRIGNLVINTNELVEWPLSLDDIIDYMEMQVYQKVENYEKHRIILYGYCELFAPKHSLSGIPYYTIKVDFSENEPIIEVFERRADYVE